MPLRLLNLPSLSLPFHLIVNPGRGAGNTTTRSIGLAIPRSLPRPLLRKSARYGVEDADQRLQKCAFETAAHFGLGADWMTSDTDVALPMCLIHSASLQPSQQIADRLHLAQRPAEAPLRDWTVALKLVRYNAAAPCGHLRPSAPTALDACAPRGGVAARHRARDGLRSVPLSRSSTRPIARTGTRMTAAAAAPLWRLSWPVHVCAPRMASPFLSQASAYYPPTTPVLVLVAHAHAHAAAAEEDADHGRRAVAQHMDAPFPGACAATGTSHDRIGGPPTWKRVRRVASWLPLRRKSRECSPERDAAPQEMAAGAARAA
ncbi:hypothetical protein GGX14DRAFT_648068 [Mycena pura]|uniref:Uncharacterized protein n=1 Tax=Mycena pura TaxID=153505 RepID=A0AAD6YDF3_9AGAR|nr:hypothetical protein GGX14DRAFT_648068 [Mycena pura]